MAPEMCAANETALRQSIAVACGMAFPDRAAVIIRPRPPLAWASLVHSRPRRSWARHEGPTRHRRWVRRGRRPSRGRAGTDRLAV